MSVFFAEFAAYVEIVLVSKEELLISGNYNIHIDVAGDSDANTLSDFFESVGLQQHVEKHTHVQGHTLDLVISRRSDNIIEDSPRVDRFLSDHGTALFSLMNNLYPANQSSYRKKYSTETALLRLKNDILFNMNKQHVTLLVLLDLSAAVDTVDHNVLLSRLHSKFPISGTALECFRSYLNGRS